MSETLRVLLAEDSGAIRHILRLRVEADPRFTVIAEATNGLEAIQMTKEHLPDVVVLDLGMPVMDGLEALPEIRAAHPDVKVAILSGFPAEKVKNQALSLGANMYIEKSESLTKLCDHLYSMAG